MRIRMLVTQVYEVDVMRLRTGLKVSFIGPSLKWESLSGSIT